MCSKMRKTRRGWRGNCSICAHAGSTVAEHIWVNAWLPINNLTHNELKMPWASATVLCIPTYVAACTHLRSHTYVCVHVPTVIHQRISGFTHVTCQLACGGPWAPARSVLLASCQRIFDGAVMLVDPPSAWPTIGGGWRTHSPKRRSGVLSH